MRVLIFEERAGNWAIVAPFPERPRGTETDAVTLARRFYPKSEIIVRRMSGEEARYAVAP